VDPHPDPHHFGNLDLHPDPDPHQIKIRTGSASKLPYKLDQEPGPDQFTDDKPKCSKYAPIRALFQGFEPLFGSQDLGSDPDPHQSHADSQH
jgi:hypothetical protein